MTPIPAHVYQDRGRLTAVAVTLLFILTAGCGGIEDVADLPADPDRQRTDNDQQANELIRRFWRDFVADGYMNNRGMTISAALLKHSLEPLPRDIQLGPANAANPLHADTVAKILASPEMKAIVERIPVGCSLSWRPFVDAALFPPGGEPEFRGSEDLFAGYQHVRLSYRGCKMRTGAILHFSMQDRYTFHVQDIEGTSLAQFLATAGANGAYLTQEYFNVIKPYDIEMTFDYVDVD